MRTLTAPKVTCDLASFVNEEGIICAVIAASGGIKTEWSGITADEADHLAATAMGMFGLARSTTGATARQVVTEFDNSSLLTICAVGVDILAVVSSADADMAAVSRQVAQFTKEMNAALGV